MTIDEITYKINGCATVSYTHLDVYKRQVVYPAFIMDKSIPFMVTLHMKQNHLFHQLWLLNFAKLRKVISLLLPPAKILKMYASL